MTKLQEIKVKNYATLVMGGLPIEEVPEELREWVALEVDRRTKEILGV